jgi:Fic family protein
MSRLRAARSTSAHRFYSMSAALRHQRNDSYAALEHIQKGTLDGTPWLAWFLRCRERAFDGIETTPTAVLRKARIWQRAGRFALNDRQRLVLDRLLDGLVGKLTTQKWAALANCAHNRALRDLRVLIEHGPMRRDQRGGRSTSYSVDDGGG